jgi:BirA family biotin operon repressor/biotin-[acetyl-CoA-carboxylase] ligase
MFSNPSKMTEGDPATQTRVFGKRVFHLETTESTNSYAASILADGIHEGTVVMAEEQTAGRGRSGRIWSSEKGKNLTFSIILRPKVPPASIGVISLYAALAVAEAIRDITGKPAHCKWPNDVLIDGRKLCGILSETSIEGGMLTSVIVGIGLNVNQTEFPPAIQPAPTSLRLAAGKSFDRVGVLSSVLDRLEKRYADLQSQRFAEIIRAWESMAAMMGSEIRVATHDGVLEGVARGIAEDGGLIVRTNGTDRKVLAGDITINS